MKEFLSLVTEVVAIAIGGLVAFHLGEDSLNSAGPVDGAEHSASGVDLGGGSEQEDAEDDEDQDFVHFGFVN